MKKVMLAMLVVVASAGVSQASVAGWSADVSTGVVLDEKVKIKPEELPEAVKSTLDKAFAGWSITAAYKYTETETYEVEVKNGAETKTVKFDKEGKQVD